MDKPIGIFDSGLGGLTVLKEVRNVLPFENIVYFGDTKRVPYGSKSKEDIIKYTFEAIDFLISKNVKVIVIACNTATAISLDLAQKKYDIPIIGVIKSGSKSVVSKTKNKVVGVIGTTATINSNSYVENIKELDKSIKVFQKACPLFVPIVEEGFSKTDVAKETAKIYLKDLINKDIDTLVLGCTHYPLLKDSIKYVVGERINLVDPAKETSITLRDVLIKKNILNKKSKNGICEYFVSDNPEKFSLIAKDLLGIEDIKVFG